MDLDESDDYQLQMALAMSLQVKSEGERHLPFTRVLAWLACSETVSW